MSNSKEDKQKELELYRWVKASERLPKEHGWVVFQWEDTDGAFYQKPFNLRDENGNIGGLTRLRWLEKFPTPSTIEQGQQGDGWIDDEGKKRCKCCGREF